MKGYEKKGMPLYIRLLICFLGFSIVISGMLVIVYYIFNRRTIEKGTEEAISQQMLILNENFEHKYKKDLIKSLGNLVSRNTLNDYLLASEIMKPIISKKLERIFLLTISDFEIYRSIYFVDYLGKEKVGVVGKRRVKELRDLKKEGLLLKDSDSASSLEASVRLFNQLKSKPLGKVHIEGPLIDEDGKVTYLAGISKLDLDTGRFGGGIIIRVSLEDFFKYLANIKFLGENSVWVFAPDGRVIKKPLNKRITFDPSAYLPRDFQENFKLSALKLGILSYQDLSIVPGTPLIRIAISIPKPLLLKHIRPAMKFFTIVFLFSIIIALIIALYISRYLSRPIVELAFAASSLAKGDFSTQVKVKTSGEIQMLVDSFNKMTEGLKTKTTSIDNLNKEIVFRKQAEGRIKQMAEEWEVTFNSIRDLISIQDKDFRIVKVNEAYAEALKMKPEEIIGKTCYEVFHGRKEPWPNCPHKQVLQIKKPVVMEFFEPRMGIYFENSVSLIFNEEGEVIGSVHVAKDITDRKLAQEQEKSLMKELEETNRIMVGRELKMIELKKEINELSGELGKSTPHDVS